MSRIEATTPQAHRHPATPRRADVQGLRGVAVLLVVAYHARVALPGGFLGVDVFLVISGFVITGLLVRGLPDGVPFANFYARRARRLLPLLSITLVATTLVAALVLDPTGPAETTARTAAAAALLNANTYLGRLGTGYFDQAPTANALLHTWSLSLEEQFYLVFPALVLGTWVLARGRRARTRWLAGTLVAAAAVSWVVALTTGDGGGEAAVDALGFTSPETFAFYAAPARAWEFLAGALVALGAHRLAGADARVLGAAGWAGAAMVAGGVLASGDTGAFEITTTTLVVVGTALLLLAGTGAGRRGLPSLLAARPVTWVGDRSYAWYLTHWPFIVFTATVTEHRAALVAAAAASLVFAAVAHRKVEEPIRADTRLVGRRAVALAAVCSIVPLLVAAGVLVVGGRHPVEPLEEAARQHFVYGASCAVEGGDVGDVERCEIPRTGAEATFALIGDSHAAHYAEALRSAAEAVGAGLSTTTSSSCPMLLDLRVQVAGADEGSCEELSRRTIDRLVAERPDVVVLATAGPRYIEEWADIDIRLTGLDGTDAETPDERAAAWERGVRATVEALSAAGLRTILVHDNPYPDLPPGRCGRLRHAVDGCRSSRDLDGATDLRARAFGAETRAVAGVDASSTFDPFPLLCDAAGCPNVRDGTWLYRDAHHLSVAASEQLGPAFAELVSAALAG